MTPNAKPVLDSAGQALFIGDEAFVAVKIKDTRDLHVLVESVNPPVREFWFVGSTVTRTTQGAASLDAEKRSQAPAAAPEPSSGTGTALDAGGAAQNAAAVLTDREKAIAHVMSHDYDRDAAEKIVEEQGTQTILADLAAETANANTQKAKDNPPPAA